MIISRYAMQHVCTPGIYVYVNIFSRDTSGLPTHRSPNRQAVQMLPLPGGLNFGQTAPKCVQKRKKWYQKLKLMLVFKNIENFAMKFLQN
jgi:hypothetical protein